MRDQVILVDENDMAIGTMSKLEAHQKGLLHRAFSIFIFNSKGELLLQQRALGKYHSGGLWSNTCCSHPLPGESIIDAANRRLIEEMGMHCSLKPAFNFIYKAPFNNGLIEYEYDHVLFGLSEICPKPDNTEVLDWKYIDPQLLLAAIEKDPENYTEWLKRCLTQVVWHAHNKPTNFSRE